MSALIEFDHVCKYYQMGDTLVKAADHISMQINKGEFVAIVGQFGSGKSTCMNIIGCLDVPAAGSNTAVQTAVTLGGFSAGEDTNAALTRGRLAKLLVAFSAYRESANTQGSTGTLSTVLNYFASGASYVCYVDGQQVTYQTSTKYPVLAGGVAIGKSTSGAVKSMRQLLPAVIDKVGAASVMSGGKKYETADNMQVYLWYKGTYYPTTLSQVNSEDYSLIGWYDASGSAAGGKIRVLIAVKKD